MMVVSSILKFGKFKKNGFILKAVDISDKLIEGSKRLRAIRIIEIDTNFLYGMGQLTEAYIG